MKPELKYENGKLMVKAAVGVDADKDAVNSVELALEISIDAMEAVNEMIKGEVPQWLKDLVASKA